VSGNDLEGVALDDDAELKTVEVELLDVAHYIPHSSSDTVSEDLCIHAQRSKDSVVAGNVTKPNLLDLLSQEIRKVFQRGRESVNLRLLVLVFPVLERGGGCGHHVGTGEATSKAAPLSHVIRECSRILTKNCPTDIRVLGHCPVVLSLPEIRGVFQERGAYCGERFVKTHRVDLGEVLLRTRNTVRPRPGNQLPLSLRCVAQSLGDTNILGVDPECVCGAL